MTQPNIDLFGVMIADQVGRPVNVASVPQRSPFRYPGGKTWFVPRLRQWLTCQSPKPSQLVEPFAGGGIISLTTAFEDLAESVHMAEMDEDVAAVWETIFSGEGEWLAKRILEFEMSRDEAVRIISTRANDIRDRAFQTIIKNRTLHGGILAAGSGFLKKGEAGKGIASRWYPVTLAKRIRDMSSIIDKISFQRGDAFDLLAEKKHDARAVFFIDPPYTAGGKNAGSRLYTHFQVDHERLFSECCQLAGDFIMTYDNSPDVRKLAVKYGLQAKPIPMKNTHHAEMTELVIGRSLDWMDDVSRVLSPAAPYGKNKSRRKKSLLLPP